MENNRIWLYMLIAIVLVVISTGILIVIDKEVEIYNDIPLPNEEEIKTSYFEKLPETTIRLLRTSTGKIQSLNINEYLIGVLAAEMPASYEMEALKAQAVVARTYTYEKIVSGSHGECSICDTYTHCQAYYDMEQILSIWQRKGYDEKTRNEYIERIKNAVYETDGIVITYNGEYIKAFFHSNSGGRTEDVSQIWGGQKIPYLLSVKSDGEESYEQYSSELSISAAKLQTQLTNSTAKVCNISLEDNHIVKILSYTSSGRVGNVMIGGSIYTAGELRNALGLRSTNFTVSQDGSNIVFKVKGFGHGVGMSQTGANYYAQIGLTYEEIIKHYYTGVDVVKQQLLKEDYNE